MKTLIALLLMLCSAIPAMADVTKDDVKKLVNAGVSDPVIVQFIRTNGPARMSAADLADLKTLGASDTVLSALIAGLQGQRPAVQTTVVVESAPVVYYWYWAPYYGGYYSCRRPYYYRPYYRPVVIYRPTVVRPVVRQYSTPRGHR